ncbi:MAG: EXPERA domain-containing protein [Polyangia bacterium]
MAHFSGGRRRLVIAWSLVSGLIHLLWEGTWSVAAPYLQTPAAQHDWRLLWTLYGAADYRYVHADPFVRILELVTGTLVAALNLGVAYYVWKRRRVAGAMVALLAASIMEVYGTLMYFGSEAINHWANVDTASFVHTWLMFFGLNALWLIFPGWCIYELVRHYASDRRTGFVPSSAAMPT